MGIQLFLNLLYNFPWWKLSVWKHHRDAIVQFRKKMIKDPCVQSEPIAIHIDPSF